MAILLLVVLGDIASRIGFLADSLASSSVRKDTAADPDPVFYRIRIWFFKSLNPD